VISSLDDIHIHNYERYIYLFVSEEITSDDIIIKQIIIEQMLDSLVWWVNIDFEVVFEYIRYSNTSVF